MDKKRIFISSVQKEFAQERRQLCSYISKDALLGKHFVPFIFEELPATNQSIRQSYLSEVQNSDIYLVIAGIKYGYEDEDGISPTEREFDEATKMNKYRICFVKTLTDKEKREKKEEAFVQNNPLIANPLYLTGYAERLGTGTADIIKQCLDIGLKPPSFSQTQHFRITFWRNVDTLNEKPHTLKANLESSNADIKGINKFSDDTLKANLESSEYPIITLRDNLEALKPLQGLPKRMNRQELGKIILEICKNEYLTVNQISRLVGRSSIYLLNEIIPPLIESQKLVRLFPATQTHQNQAFKTNQNYRFPNE